MSHAVGKDWALLGQGRTLTRPGAAGREVKAQAPLSAHILRVASQERQQDEPPPHWLFALLQLKHALGPRLALSLGMSAAQHPVTLGCEMFQLPLLGQGFSRLREVELGHSFLPSHPESASRGL